MRHRPMKRNRKQTMVLLKAVPQKDSEGNSYTDYESPSEFMGEQWPAGGEVQAKMYGQELAYIRNVRIEGEYSITTDAAGIAHYVFDETGMDVCELDGVCIDTTAEQGPDYRITAIRPYRPLSMEVKQI